MSVLDLAFVGEGETPADSLRGSVALAQAAENSGFLRVWYAEHHNMPSIASSAPAVVIAHIAEHTSTIRLGAGGVMLPNHSPLSVAEQFGTLAELHPGRIDLGLGRAPGGDQAVLGALRRTAGAAERFPDDVQELQGYLQGRSIVRGVTAMPGAGTNVPLYILGSSLFGASLAAALGLPFGFASHFAPAALHDALQIYRNNFTPSESLAEPYAIVGVNAIADDTAELAQHQLNVVLARRIKMMVGPGRKISDDEAFAVLNSPQGTSVRQMLKYTAVGTASTVQKYLDDFAAETGADELMVAFQSPTTQGQRHSLELTAGVTTAA